VMSTLSILWVLMKSVWYELGKELWVIKKCCVRIVTHWVDIMAFILSQSSSETWFWALFDLVDSIFWQQCLLILEAFVSLLVFSGGKKLLEGSATAKKIQIHQRRV
jgi:hypothetical protein